jgi:hypothetical protein
MTVAELIDQVMHRVRVRFYSDREVREWRRDENALLKAVSRYGYECAQRGWEFEAAVLGERIVALLNRIERPARPEGGQEIWFPKYLEACVDQHVRERAEEIQAAARAAKSPAAITAGVLAGVKVAEVPPPNRDAELLGQIYQEQRRRQKAAAERRQAGSAAAKAQPELFKAGSGKRPQISQISQIIPNKSRHEEQATRPRNAGDETGATSAQSAGLTDGASMQGRHPRSAATYREPAATESAAVAATSSAQSAQSADQNGATR